MGRKQEVEIRFGYRGYKCLGKMVLQIWLGNAFVELSEVYMKCEITGMWRKRLIRG
jgi:hypothetical protein